MLGSSSELGKAALSALHYSGLSSLASRYIPKNGVVFTLHHVTPAERRPFEPNGKLKIKPAFLEAVIESIRRHGFETIGLDDVRQRLIGKRRTAKPFAVFTLDGAYKDSLEFAYPIFRRLGVPFTVYVPITCADGEGDLWWLTLEEALRRLPDVKIDRDGVPRVYMLSNDRDKAQAFESICQWLRSVPEARARAVTRGMALQAGIDPVALCRERVMNWNDIRTLAKDSLATIAAHTCGRFALARLPAEEAAREIEESVQRVSREIGKPCRHLSYPCGDRRVVGAREFEIARTLGLETAVTSRRGLIRWSHAECMTALPRLSLHGDLQQQRYVTALLSGLPYAIRDGFLRAVSPFAGEYAQ